MFVFLDTEYTGLQPPDARKLLSLALVAEDGSAEWYAELDGWELADCDPWVQRHPSLIGGGLGVDVPVLSITLGPHLLGPLFVLRRDQKRNPPLRVDLAVCYA